MRYQWGPLLRDGGERRLNVAATRARRRLTVVSSFSSHDVDPVRLTAPGARMLAEYLEYARAGGVPVAPVPASSAGYAGGDGRQGDGGADGADGAFQSDVAARLAALGITVVPQYGVGGYRVDFAAAHPDDPARMILAIEADGAGYRDSGSVRDRDRLRKEHLERLGWHVHRLWSTAWFTDPGGELAKLRAAFDTAVRAAPPAPPVTPLPADQPAPARRQAGGPGPASDPAGEPEPTPRLADEPAGPPGTASWPRPAAPPGAKGAPAPAAPGPRADAYWPMPRDAVQSVRAIPLGPGERPALSTPGPKALPVSAGAVPVGTGPAALPPAPAQDDPEPAGKIQQRHSLTSRVTQYLPHVSLEYPISARVTRIPNIGTCHPNTQYRHVSPEYPISARVTRYPISARVTQDPISARVTQDPISASTARRAVTCYQVPAPRDHSLAILCLIPDITGKERVWRTAR